MKYELIKTDNYLLVVDDLNRPAKEGETFLSKEGIIHTNTGYNYGDKLIIAHIPLNNSPILEGVDLLPPLPQVEDVEKLSENFLKDLQVASTSVNRSVKLGFEVGYNIAKETYKYTEEEVRELLLMQRGNCYVAILNKTHDKELASLASSAPEPRGKDGWVKQQPKLPIAFECETETPFVDGFTEDRGRRFYGNPEPKTITNSQGQTEWVGKYIF